MRRPLLRAALLLGVLSGAVLGYGYLHSITHGACHVDIHFVTNPEEGAQPMPKAKVTFLDGSGRVLAEGVSDDRYNFVHMLHPEVGDCHEVEETAPTSREG